MTKKSLARRMRDDEAAHSKEISTHEEKIKGRIKEVASDNAWDSLMQMRATMQQLFSAHLELAVTMEDQELLTFVDDQQKMRTLLKLVQSDLQPIIDNAKQIYDLHKDYTGSWKNPEEMSLGITCMSRYQELMQDHQAIVEPTAAQLVEQLSIAEFRRTESKKAQSAGAAVDVDFVETPKSETKEG